MTQNASPVLLPGSTIGIFGGGQLGRLTAIAARTMGYRIHVLDPDPGCPARFVVDQCVEADWSDAHEAARLARGCDVITLEIEQVSLASMNAAGAYAPVRPSESLLGVNALAAPIFEGGGGMVGAIAILGSIQFVEAEPSAPQIRHLRQAAARISAQLGDVPRDGVDSLPR